MSRKPADTEPVAGAAPADEGDRPPAETPLAGRVVLDLAQQLPAGYATYLLAEMGARVIKVEPPWGDSLRHLGPGIFAMLSSRKEVMTLDLGEDDSAESLRDLLNGADAIVVSGRIGSQVRRGIDYDAIQKLSPGIAYCALGAYDPPDESRPGHDLDVLAESGLLSLIGPEVAPLGVPLIDLAAGAVAAAGIAAALAGPRSGARVDVTLAGVARSWSALAMAVSTMEGLATAGSRPHTAASAGYGVFHGSDDEAFVVSAVEERFWKLLLAETGLPPEYADWDITRRRNEREHANGELAAVFRTRTCKQWLQALARAGIPAAPIRSAVEVELDAVARNDYVISSKEDGSLRVRFPSPTFGFDDRAGNEA